MTITLRSTKGAPLSHAELDGNFADLDGRTDTGFANPMTTVRDIIVGGASGAPTRVAGPAASGTFALQCIDGTFTWVAVV